MKKEDKEMPQVAEAPKVLPSVEGEKAVANQAWDDLFAAQGNLKTRSGIDTQDYCREERGRRE